MDGEVLSEFFGEPASFSSSATWPDDIFCVLEAWENSSRDNNKPTSLENSSAAHDPAPLMKDGGESFEFQNQKCAAHSPHALPTCKKRKLVNSASPSQLEEGQQKISHIAVERNRRKQMNEHLSVLRSLMPTFYVKRGDQASIIGGVVDYINELQQLLQSLEAKKQRKAAAYNEVLLSPRLLSPRTPLPSSPYKPRMQQQPVGFINSPSSLPSPVDPSPCNSSTSSINDAVNELVATSKSASAEVEVKFSGPNLLLKTASRCIPGQVVKIISALEELALQILHVSISTVDQTMLNFFTIKIGIQCQLSAEELAEKIQQTFC